MAFLTLTAWVYDRDSWTSFQLASKVLQGIRKTFPLSLPAHPLFMLQPWNVACVLCGCEGVSTIQPGCPRLSPWAWGEVEPSLSSWSALSRNLPDSLGGYLRSHRCCSWHQSVQIFSLYPCWGLNHSSARKQASQPAPYSVLSYCWTGQISAWFSFKCSLQREGREGSHLY